MAHVQVISADDGTSCISNRNELHAHVIDILRTCDEGILLPGATRASDKGWFSNAIFSINGGEARPPGFFKPDWGHGIAVARVTAESAERLLSSDASRKAALAALANKIRNEVCGDDSVGPRLGASDVLDDASDNWTAGFDSTACSCGLYSASEQKVAAGGIEGMRRAHRSYFLVVKAGAGLAGEEFHAKFNGLLAKGKTLDEILPPGRRDDDRALAGGLTEGTVHRVVAAGRRNRARILMEVAAVLGLAGDVEDGIDHAASTDHSERLALTLTDVVTNTLVRHSLTTADGSDASHWVYYSGASAPPPASTGAIMSSNVSEGYVLLLSDRDSDEVCIRNDMRGALPFGSQRIRTPLEAYKNLERNATHPDADWISRHFSWRQGSNKAHIEPPQLWGTHSSLNHERWMRAVGISSHRSVALAPELVLLAGAEDPTLRAVVAQLEKMR